MAKIETEVLPSGLVRTYSDDDTIIKQDGTLIAYDEAVDPAGKNRKYSKTNTKRKDREIS